MKKFFKYLGAILAGTLVISSCVREEIETLNPEDGVAQTLGEIKGCTLNADADAITTTYTEVDFDLSVPTVYSLNIAAHGAEEINTKLSATISDGQISIAQKDLNSALLNMGAEPDVEFALDFQLVASPATDKGAAIATYTVYSNVVTASFIPYSTTVLDVDKYDHIWIIGAAESIGAWNHGNVFQYLYNYNGDGNTYSGMIYYTGGAAGGWKLTGGPDWDHGNWGSPDQAEDTEAASITLIDDGGSKDIKCYELPYYMWTFDKSTLTLKKEFGFTTMGIVGAFNEWNPADENCVMAYNAQYHRFYIDYDFAADTELKFTADGKWDLNFGTDMEQNGGNIAVTAGKYRIYLDFNKNEYTFDESMYGKEEPGAGTTTPDPEPDDPEKPVPPTMTGWGIVGEVTNWGNLTDDNKYIADVKLTSDGTYLVAKGVALEGQFKFRKDGDWGVNFGASGDVEPFELTPNAETELVAGGKNFTIATGTYDVYFDETNAKAWFINDGSYPGGGAAPVVSEWGLIGVAGDWNNNVLMYEEGEWIVARNVTFSDNNEFKFRKGNSWGTELVYEGVVSIDAEYACTAGSGNSKIAQGGTYDVYLAATLDKFYVMTPGKTPADAGEAVVTYIDPSAESFVVGFSGSAIGWDDPAFDQGDRAIFVSKNVADAATFAGTYEFKLEGLAVAENDELKVRINGQWIGVGGATVEGLTVTGTDNFVAGEAGIYNVVITFAWDGLTHSDVKVVFSK